MVTRKKDVGDVPKDGMVIDVAVKLSPSRVSLTSLDDVRTEMARVYRQCKSGQRDIKDGSRLVYQLQCIAQVISDSVIEKRLDALENGASETNALEGGTMPDAAHLQTIDYQPIRMLANGT